MKLLRRMAALAGALVGLASMPAHALTVLDLSLSEPSCGLIGVDGSVTAQPCSGLSFSAALLPGEAVFVSATLHYEYRDDGLVLPAGAWSFVRPGPGPYPPESHEAGALYFVSNACASAAECLRQPVERVDVFSQSGRSPLILGNNDVPDSLTGEIRLFATSGVLAGWLSGGQRTAFIGVDGFTLDGRGLSSVPVAPAIPEPTTAALMLAGLAALALARRAHPG